MNWKFGDVLRHPKNHYKTRVMVISDQKTSYETIVLHDEDILLPPDNIETVRAWPIGDIRQVGTSWLKVNGS